VPENDRLTLTKNIGYLERDIVVAVVSFMKEEFLHVLCHRRNVGGCEQNKFFIKRF